MRKISLIGCILCICLVGCGSNESATNKAYVNNQTTVAQVLAEQTNDTKPNNVPQQTQTSNVDTNKTEIASQDSKSKSAESDTEYNIVDSANEKTYDSIDVDLSTMSSSLVYSEVLNIMTNPDDYIGKVIKMSGKFTFAVDSTDNNTYLACIIQDATACCAQGIEFQPYKKDMEGKDVIESAGKDITVVGTFDKYNIGPNSYFTLKDARILAMN